ncbi:uncharacterized protein LOC143227361 [Tachypleus tridentatus]|uniref:uncharacterized protein LOC143227361 n=1 Tax=Tachypleus tridentatus TaxID=6853 RepID=UPI003FD242FC
MESEMDKESSKPNRKVVRATREVKNDLIAMYEKIGPVSLKQDVAVERDRKEKEPQKESYLTFLWKVTPLPNNNNPPTLHVPHHLSLTPSALFNTGGKKKCIETDKEPSIEQEEEGEKLHEESGLKQTGRCEKERQIRNLNTILRNTTLKE